MVYKRYYFQVIFLQALLAITMFAFTWTLFLPHMVVTSINLGMLVVGEVGYILYVLSKTNRDLARFFEAFRFKDSTVTFKAYGSDKSYAPLLRSLDSLLQEFRDLRANLEHEKFFYQHALNHIAIGLLVIDQNGNIRFSNRAIQKMLNMSVMDNLKHLNRLKPGLAATVLQLTPNNKELIKVVLNNEMVQLSLRCSVFRIDEEFFRIISFQDIKFEIETNEGEAWQKLIKILTHEIMNSVSPITLTSSGLIQLLEKKDVLSDELEANEEVFRDQLLTGLQAIRKRSKGLASFVEGYQSINQLPKPVSVPVPVQELFKQVEALMTGDLHKNSIKLEVSIIPPSLKVHADDKLIGQVLINLVQNAIYALQEQPDKTIRLSAYQVHDQVRISVTDNGRGIPPELLDSVFVPFYTTRECGSGIGLSLSREIMKLHGGGIQVQSEPGKGTSFTLVF